MITETLEPAILLKRYKRFLADVEFPSGKQATIHCPNPGSMLGIAEPGTRIWLRPAKAGRKLSHTWVVSEVSNAYVCVDTLMANRLLYETLNAGKLLDILPYERIKRESTFGNSRFDFFLSGADAHKDCFLEVKSTTLAVQQLAMFPDAVTARGLRHLEELIKAAAEGYRAVQFFCLARADVAEFRPADHIDVEYGRALRLAAEKQVDVFAYKMTIERIENVFTFSTGSAVPVRLD